MRAVKVAVTYAAAIAVGAALWLWVAGFTRVWCPDQAIYLHSSDGIPSRPGACLLVHGLPDWVAALSGVTGCVAVLVAGSGVRVFLGRRRHT